MLLNSFISTVLLALAVAANPVVVRRSPVTLSLSRRLNVTSIHNLVRHDQNRAKLLKARGEARARGVFQRDEDSVPANEQVDNQAVTYIASVGVGSPATTFSLIIDTGSSNTWVGATTAFTSTSTTKRTADTVAVTYGSGSFSGNEFIDQVSLGNSGLVIPSQSIGVAKTSVGFAGVDGILGIGPTILTQGTLSPDVNSLIPTVTDNLFAAGTIPANEIGISFNPTQSVEILNGELTWGGTDSTKLTGTVSFTPITTTSPSSFFWGINQSVRYSTSTNILSSTAGIVDTGTTLLLLASDALTRYRTATGAVVDGTTGLLRITSAQFTNLKSLFFTTNGVTLEFTANAQLWPRALNTAIGGQANLIYLIVNDLGTTSGQGFDFVNGFAFLERFYSVFDTANKRVGFASTPFTTATSN